MPAEPQIIRSLTYPISPDYVRSNWTLERGIAEFVANAIDADRDGFRFEWSDGVLVIEDFGPGVPEEGLVLGWSDKTRRQIRTWGEGLKIGSLVVARSRRVGRIVVESVGYGFIPKITKGSPVGSLAEGGEGEAKGFPLLRYDFFRSDRKRGTKITIEDCPKEDADAVRDRFLYFREGYEPPRSPGRVLREGPGGIIYIGGVLVQENPKLHFSYDLALEDAKQLQNRDRTEISGWRLDALCSEARARAAEEDEAFLLEWARALIDGELAESEAQIAFTPAVRRGLRSVRRRLFGDKALWPTWGPRRRRGGALLAR